MTLLNAKGYTRAAWAGVALMAATVAVLGVRGVWLGFGVCLLFLACSAAFMLARNELPALFDLLFVVAALANGAGWVWELYSDVPGYDEIVHAYTAFAASLYFGFALYYSMRVHFHTVNFGLAIVTMGIAAGALWEMFEWLIIKIKDPVPDLMIDSLGALIAALFGTWVLKVETRADRPARTRSQRKRGPRRLPAARARPPTPAARRRRGRTVRRWRQKRRD